MGYKLVVLGLLACSFAAETCSVARADDRLSVYVGPTYTSEVEAYGSSFIEPEVMLGYDLATAAKSPVRVRLDFDDRFTTQPGQGIGSISLGASVRSATPTYAGVGVSIAYVTDQPFQVYPAIESTSVCPSTGCAFTPYVLPNNGAVEPGVRFFVGQKLGAIAGVHFSFEASYALNPTKAQAGLVSAAGIGLRTSF